jgi:hypothetical protein
MGPYLKAILTNFKKVFCQASGFKKIFQFPASGRMPEFS